MTQPTRVVLGPNGWEPSDAPARPGFVAWRFPLSREIAEPPEDRPDRMPRPPRLRDGRPRNYGKR
jgi:hypothetical protein